MYTGNTDTSSNFDGSLSVYPCVYREHLNLIKQSARDAGLSLCIQGTPILLLVSVIFSRFIPVYTGNTIAELAASGKLSGLSLCIQGTL